MLKLIRDLINSYRSKEEYVPHEHEWSVWFGPFYIDGKPVAQRRCATCHKTEVR
jgi:hypothetical protein